MTSSAQLFGATLIVAYLALLVRFVRRGHLRAKYTFLWLSVGSASLVLVVFPALLDELASLVGIYYSPTLLFVVAIMTLMSVALHFSWELSRMEDRLRTIAEQQALLASELDERRSASEGGPR